MNNPPIYFRAERITLRTLHANVKVRTLRDGVSKSKPFAHPVGPLSPFAFVNFANSSAILIPFLARYPNQVDTTVTGYAGIARPC